MPVAGTVKLVELQPEHVRRCLDRMRARGLHARTIVHARAALQRVLRDALRDGLVGRNVASGDYVDVETPEPRKLTVIDPADRQRVLAAVREDRLRPVYVLAFATGARLGELLGLRWADVYEDRVEFVQTVARVGNRTVISKPKNAQSRRTFPMNATIRAALLDQKRRQEWGLTGWGRGSCSRPCRASR